MVDKTEKWSRSWNSSTQPSKQRKYQENAPLHVKDKLVSVNVHPELREELGTRSIPVRTGDRARVMRGDEAGKEGIVSNVDRREKKIYINGIEVERTDGTVREKALRPSNLQVQALNIEDNRRLEKYEVEDLAGIKVEEEEMDEVLEEEEEEGEMMQQMQTGESSLEAEDGEEVDEETETEEVDEETDEETDSEDTGEAEEEEESGEETAEQGAGADYSDTVSGTISDAKEELEEMDSPDFEAALEAEKSNKNRKTFVEWLENKQEE